MYIVRYYNIEFVLFIIYIYYMYIYYVCNTYKLCPLDTLSEACPESVRVNRVLVCTPLKTKRIT